jgi:oxygen-dependent protoporphyrinogen oxidase
MARAALEPLLPRRPVPNDALGPMVSSRFGREVLERLVDPLIGGINAGDSERLSASAVTPQIDSAARRSRSLLLGLRAERKANPPDPDAPVFYTVRGGVGRLVDRLVDALSSHPSPVEISLDSPVAGVDVDSAGVTVLAGTSPRNHRRIAADGAVIACPAGPAASALAELSPAVATTLRSIDYASVALVTLAFDDAAMGRDLDASGLLVPKPEQKTVTACSWASSKWSHWRVPGQTIIRASAGRDGDDHALHLDDTALVDAVLADLRRLMAVRADPTEVRVSRWIKSFPQYRPGHLDRVAEVERALATEVPGIVLAGAAYRGLGIPACIRQGQGAAQTVLARLRERAASE